MLAFPLRAVALRKFERNPTPSNKATGFPFSSRKRKLPLCSFTRRTSGLKAVEAGRVGSAPSGVVGITGGAAFAGAPGITASARSGAFVGRRHFPFSFCFHTTCGWMSETSLITSRPENNEAICTRSRNASACRKSPPPVSSAFGIVMPVNFKPHHGVTLIRWIFSVVPSRSLSSCSIRACVPRDCTYKFTAKSATTKTTPIASASQSARRVTFFTSERYAASVLRKD